MSEGSRSTHSSELLQVLVSLARGQPLQEVARVQCGNLHSVPISGDHLPQVAIPVPLHHILGLSIQLKEQRVLSLSGNKTFCDKFAVVKALGEERMNAR